VVEQRSDSSIRGSGLGLDRPYPQRRRPLPRRIDDVTPAWLTELLAYRFEGVVVEGFEEVERTASHTTKLRLSLQLNETARTAGLPQHVCLKSNWSGMRTGDICEREARFYHFVRGRLDAPVPRAFYADWDDDGSGQGIVVMEDLARSPGRFGSSADHLGVDGVAAGLESLAVLHGSSWASDRTAHLNWLTPSMDTPVDTEQVIQFWNYIRVNLADPQYSAVVPAWVYERPELMQHVLDELSAYERSLPGPKGLVHGDAHQGNSYLRADGERLWLDWQLARRGSPWRDVSYFVVSSLTVEERRAADRELLAHYLDRLASTGAEGVPSLDGAWEHFVRWPGYGIQAWLGNVNQWGQRSGAEMVRRSFAAADDYDTVRLLTDGRTPQRAITLGVGAYRLPVELQARLDELAG